MKYNNLTIFDLTQAPRPIRRTHNRIPPCQAFEHSNVREDSGSFNMRAGYYFQYKNYYPIYNQIAMF